MNPLSGFNELAEEEARFAFLSWRPARTVPDVEKTPVTLLSGFLGSGKTTTLLQILGQRPDTRFGLLINDIGEVNLDADTVRAAFPQQDPRIDLLKELSQGCICCSIGDSLADALVYLHEHTAPDHLLVEASGAANPRNVLQSFYTRNAAGHSLLEVFRIANLVTVLDAGHFFREWCRAEGDTRQKRRIFLNDPRKPYLELILDQIETCDLLVINKADLLSEAELHKVRGILADLNERAEQIVTTQGGCDPALILDRHRFQLQKTQRASAIDQRLALPGVNALPKPSLFPAPPKTHGYGLQTLVYRARKPFREKELFQILRSRIPGLLRAKGFYWSNAHPDQCGILSIAGGVLRADRAGPWYADLVEQGHARLEDMPEFIRVVWEEDVGDRRQEIVLIGLELDEVRITGMLDQALVEG